MAGICLIRLGSIRGRDSCPEFAGLTSENAAHRIAVEWDECGAIRDGVFIPRRDTNALLNRLVGGRLFLGVHQAAEFRISRKQTIISNWKCAVMTARRSSLLRVVERAIRAREIRFSFSQRSVGILSRAAHSAGLRALKKVNSTACNSIATNGGWNP